MKKGGRKYDKEYLVALLKSVGGNQVKMAKILGCTPGNVTYALQSHNIDNSEYKFKEFSDDELLKIYSENNSTRKTAKHFGTNKSTIRTRLHRLNACNAGTNAGTKYSKDELIDLLEEFEYNQRKVAKYLNCTPANIGWLIKLYSLNRKAPQFSVEQVLSAISIACSNAEVGRILNCSSVNVKRLFEKFQIKNTKQIFKNNKIERWKIDSPEKQHRRLRIQISRTINTVLFKKKASPTELEILKNLDYTIEELQIHLEQRFKEWMNWDNHRRYHVKEWNDNDSSTWVWNIQHIVAQCELPYISYKDENFKKCWALSNIIPFSAKDNVLEGVQIRIRRGKEKAERLRKERAVTTGKIS